MKKPTVREIRTFLQGKSQEQLTEDIIMLYGKFDGVKELVAVRSVLLVILGERSVKLQD